MEHGNYHSVELVVAGTTSLLLGRAVPSVFASLVIASTVITGRLCCRRCVTGEDCVRPWCGPRALATPAAGVDEPERKPRRAPAEKGGCRPSVCERACVAWRGTGAKRGSSPTVPELAPGA